MKKGRLKTERIRKPDSEPSRNHRLEIVIRTGLISLAALIVFITLLKIVSVSIEIPELTRIIVSCLFFGSTFGLSYHAEIRRIRKTMAEAKSLSDMACRTCSLDTAIQNVFDIVIAIDSERRITLLNRAAETATGWTLACAKGRPLEEILRLEALHDNRKLSLSTNAAGRKLKIVSSTGKISRVEESCTNLVGPDGGPAGTVFIYHDITDIIRSLELEDFGKIGTIQYTIDGSIKTINSACLTIFELNDAFTSPSEVIGRRLSDLVLYSSSYRQVQRDILRHEFLHDYEYSIITLMGNVRWLRQDSSIAIDSTTGEKIVKVIIRDITDRRTAELTLAEKSLYLESILSSEQSAAVIATDRIFRIKYISRAAADIFQCDRIGSVGKSIAELHHRDKVDPTALDKAMEAIKSGGTYTYHATRKIDGNDIPVEALVSGIIGDNIQPVGYLITLKVSAQQKPEQHVYSESRRSLQFTRGASPTFNYDSSRLTPRLEELAVSSEVGKK